MLCNFPKATESVRGEPGLKLGGLTNFWAREILFSLFKSASKWCSDIFEKVETSLKKTGINLLSCSNWEIY